WPAGCRPGGPARPRSPGAPPAGTRPGRPPGACRVRTGASGRPPMGERGASGARGGRGAGGVGGGTAGGGGRVRPVRLAVTRGSTRRPGVTGPALGTTGAGERHLGGSRSVGLGRPTV